MWEIFVEIEVLLRDILAEILDVFVFFENDIPRKYVLASTYEFLDIIRATEASRGVMVSLDVESLFTNVPVEDTIQIVIDNVYNHHELAPPNTLLICFETCF